MKKSKSLFLFLSLMAVLALALTACGAGEQGPPGPAGPAGPAGPEGPAGPPGEAAALEVGDLTCTECHGSDHTLAAKMTAWEESNHGSGESFARGTSAGCAGCHSGAAFTEMVAAGLNPGTVEAGDPEPVRQDCRTCHQVHTTYTGEDWALTTTEPVAFYAIEGVTFDGGKGNLCVNCHQPRRDVPVAENGVVTGINSHWGPHHGPQSAMLLGLAGAGVEGSPSLHGSLVEDTCVACHLGENGGHGFEANLSTCVECHEGAENFDINGLQTDVQALLDELGDALVAAGVLDVNAPEGHPIVEEAPENVAYALWNWIYVAHEDKSLGVHNPSYTIDLLEYSLELLQQ